MLRSSSHHFVGLHFFYFFLDFLILNMNFSSTRFKFKSSFFLGMGGLRAVFRSRSGSKLCCCLLVWLAWLMRWWWIWYQFFVHFLLLLVLTSLVRSFLEWPLGSKWLVWMLASFLVRCLPLWPEKICLSWSKL